jgi:hypothetical protein
MATYSVWLNQIFWNWLPVAGANGYKYNTVNNYATATDALNTTVFNQTGLTCLGAANQLYVWAYNACGASPVTIITSNLNYNLTINKTGAGSGVVTSDIGAIN